MSKSTDNFVLILVKLLDEVGRPVPSVFVDRRGEIVHHRPCAHSLRDRVAVVNIDGEMLKVEIAGATPSRCSSAVYLNSSMLDPSPIRR
jgi:hypothetical protein